MEPYGTIYCITNIINGKRYIGQTIYSIESRWRRHCKNAMSGYKKHFYASIRKYGIENFVVDELYKCGNQEELNISEQYYIFEYNTITDNGVGYNMTWGGHQNGVPSEKTRIKMSISHLGKKHSEEQIKKQIITKRKNGVFEQSLETKKKRSESHIKHYKNNPDILKKRVETRRKNGWFIKDRK